MAVHKSGFSEGELVTMSDQKDCEIIKLMNLSAKIKLPDGTQKIAPYSILQKQGGSKEAIKKETKKAAKKTEKKETKKAAKKETPKKEAPKKSSRRRTGKKDMVVHSEKVGEPIQQSLFDDNDKPKKGSRRRTIKKEAPKKEVKKEVVKEVTKKSEAPKKKLPVKNKIVKNVAPKKVVKKDKAPVYKNKPDEVTEYLEGTKSVNVILTRIRKHPAFVAVNKKSFANLKAKKDELSYRVFKMSCMNMLRSAIRKV